MDQISQQFTVLREGPRATYRLAVDLLEAQEEVIRRIMEDLEAGVREIILDRRGCAPSEAIQHAQTVGAGVGLLLRVNGAGLVILLNDDDIYGKVLGFEIMRFGGRVLSTPDEAEADRWLHGLIG